MIIRFIFILLSGLIVLPVAALELQWNKNPASDGVGGYRIFMHPITNNTTFKAVKFGPDVLNISKNTKKVKGKSIVFFKLSVIADAKTVPEKNNPITANPKTTFKNLIRLFSMEWISSPKNLHSKSKLMSRQTITPYSF